MKYVYLIQVQGMDVYKIGHSKNPKQRLKSVQTGNPFKCILIDSYKTNRASQIETALHHRFASRKIDENEFQLEGEWFRLHLEDIVSFITTCQKIDVNFQVIEENSTLFLNKKSGI